MDNLDPDDLRKMLRKATINGINDLRNRLMRYHSKSPSHSSRVEAVADKAVRDAVKHFKKEDE